MVYVPSEVAVNLYKRLEHIQALAKEIEDIPNFGPDMWTMREGDRKCQLIAEEARWMGDLLQKHVGTGDG